MKNTGTIYSSADHTPVVLPELAELLPPLTDEQTAALEADLLKNGCYAPVIVNEDIVVIDGHNRKALCEKHNLPYQMAVFAFDDLLEAKQWALDTQKGRRNLDKWELGKIALKLMPNIEARARANQSAAGGDKFSEKPLSATLPEAVSPIDTRKELAEAVGLKNLLALTMALAKNQKTLSGKVNLGRMLKQTRDLRTFAMTPAQYQKFKRQAGKQKILFSAVHSKDGKGKFIDVIMPVTELDRANVIFERILPQREQPEQEQERQTPAREPPARQTPVQEAPNRQAPEQRRADAPKKDSPSGRDSHVTKTSSDIPEGKDAPAMTSERPSVEGRLRIYRAQLQQRKASAPGKAKAKIKLKAKAR